MRVADKLRDIHHVGRDVVFPPMYEGRGSERGSERGTAAARGRGCVPHPRQVLFGDLCERMEAHVARSPTQRGPASALLQHARASSTEGGQQSDERQPVRDVLASRSSQPAGDASGEARQAEAQPVTSGRKGGKMVRVQVWLPSGRGDEAEAEAEVERV